jgi:predicted flap endonuclease-1-like 5' DNA nuclease
MKTQDNASDRRRHPRKEVNIPVELQLPDGSRLPARLGQLSIGGSFIEAEAIQGFGTELKLLFRLPGRTTEFAVSAVVRWSSASGMGVQFGAMRAREIYELSEFLVDKPAIDAAPPVPRTPLLQTGKARLPGRSEPARAAPGPQGAHPPAPLGAPTPRPAPSPPGPSATEKAETPAPAAPQPQESELDRAKCEIERLASELVQTQDQLERAQADAEQRAEALRSLEAQLATRSEQLRKAQTERAPGQDQLRIAEAELALRTEQLRKLGAELAQLEQKTQPLVAALATRQAELARRQADLDEREEQLRTREAALARAPALAFEQADDLTRIRGIGPAFARALRSLGVSRFGQIAAWTDADIDRIAPGLKLTPARIRRQEWVKLAAELDQGRPPVNDPPLAGSG